MSKHKKYAPTHRATPAPGVPRKALRNTLVLSSVAVATTGAAVGGGVLSSTPSSGQSVSDVALAKSRQMSAAEIAERQQEQPSRSDRRDAADPAKTAALASPSTTGEAYTRTEDIRADDPRAIARALLGEFGFSQSQFGCLDSLYSSESGWRVDADNPRSSAYGIPQALPGSKMASAGDDWMYNPETQIRWGLGYIEARYGSPCSAWGFKRGHGWY